MLRFPPEGDGPLRQINGLITQFMKVVRKLWTFGQHWTWDESMIKCKKKNLAIRQYQPKKPIKHGIKVYVIADSLTGVPLAMEVYKGKGKRDDDEAEDPQQRSLVSLVDRLLAQPGSIEKGHILYMDNFFTSIQMAQHLHEKYTMYMTGTSELSETNEVNTYTYTCIRT